MRVLREAVLARDNWPLLYDKLAMSNTYSHAKNHNDPRPIILSNVAFLESGFSAVAILGGGWLQSPASDGPPYWRYQAKTWTYDESLSIGPLVTNLSETLIRIPKFSFQKMHLKKPSAKLRPFCSGINVLRQVHLIVNNGQWGPCNPYKPCNHNLYIGINIFPHIDDTQTTGYN